MDLVKHIQNDISKIDGRITKQYRKIAAKYKREINLISINEVYRLCESLLKNKKWAETIIAYQIIFDQKKKYEEDTFLVFEKWLFLYVEDWWDCDDFMTHAFQYVLMIYPQYIDRINAWMNHPNFAVRRSAAVILIRPAQKGLIKEKIIFKVCDTLINDSHHLVQKGFGWLLKESTLHYYDAVVSYLEKNHSALTRTAFRYAIEKMSEESRIKLISL